MSRNYPGIFEKLTKHGNRYQVKWRGLDGAQGSKTFTTLKAARDFQARVKADKSRGTLLDSRRGKVAFGEYAKQWVLTKPDHRPSTARRRDGILQKHLIPALGDRPLNQIRFSDIQTLVTTWQQAGLSPNSILNHMHVLNPIFEMAVDDEIIAKNPAKRVKTPRPNRTEPRALTPEEIDALRCAIDSDYRPMLEIFLATGMRWSELADLTIGDLSLLKKELTVRRSKTDAGARTITLDESDVKLISKHLRATGRDGSDTASPLFTSPSGLKLHYRNFVQRVFNPACKKAGIADVTVHTLRRTHATMLVDAGMNPKVVQQRMGHKSIQTTLGHYTDTTERARKDAASVKQRYMNQAGSNPSGVSEIAN